MYNNVKYKRIYIYKKTSKKTNNSREKVRMILRSKLIICKNKEKN